MNAAKVVRLEPSPRAAELLRVADAAAHLGVSRPSIYRLVESGQLTHYSVLGKLRFRRQDLDAFLARCMRPAKEP